MNASSRLQRRDARGFTLIELMVSLVAGLFVSLAVIALSKEVTNTFHEEGRTAAAQMALRTASERLRNDLIRASYMSTPNIQTDPLVAHAPGQPNVSSTAALSLKRLAGIRLNQGGSYAAMPLSALTDNNAGGTAKSVLNPDAIDISGDFTTTEPFVVRSVTTGGPCNGSTITLAADSPAMWRATNGITDNITLQKKIAAAFQPVSNNQFLIRVEDDTGHYQFAPTCATASDAVVVSGTIGTSSLEVVVNTSTALLTGKDTLMNGGASGLGVGRFTVNPVQTVRWEIRPINSTTYAGDAAFSAMVDAAGGKYDLFREWVDLSGNVIGASTDLVAEYAIDLKFAFSADLAARTATRALTVYGLTDTAKANQTLAGDVSATTTATPQRIRSARFRLSTRSAVADRTVGVNAAGDGTNSEQPTYPLRYCMVATGCSTNASAVWARVRSVTSEVALPNQAKVFF